MITTSELIYLKEKAVESKNEESLNILSEIERLNIEAWDYKNIVLRTLTTIEADMNRLIT